SERLGFTLAELLVALVITSLIITAAATLAYAVSAANDTADDTSQKQAQLRYATLRVSDVIRHCKLICGTADNDLAVWLADDNADGQISPKELVYLEAGLSRDSLQLLEFPFADDWPLPLSSVQSGTAKQELELIYGGTRTALVPQCQNVQFVLDEAAPWTESVTLSFELVENGTTRQYEISAVLRARAGNLLGPDGDYIASDDD
ncbi:MAG: prepilin-type N-terminal cleavage/methylation domain-containing protein, partial [Planctomycetota bacterium]